MENVRRIRKKKNWEKDKKQEVTQERTEQERKTRRERGRERGCRGWKQMNTPVTLLLFLLLFLMKFAMMILLRWWLLRTCIRQAQRKGWRGCIGWCQWLQLSSGGKLSLLCFVRPCFVLSTVGGGDWFYCWARCELWWMQEGTKFESKKANVLWKDIY